jgi:PleD family two-component response regulator
VDARAEAARALEAASEHGSGSVTIRSTAAEESFLELFLVRRMERGAGPVANHVFLRDVTERARSEAEARALASELEAANHMLDRQASVDPLTGLLNRRGLHRHIRHLGQVTRRPVHPMSVIFVDLDDF